MGRSKGLWPIIRQMGSDQISVNYIGCKGTFLVAKFSWPCIMTNKLYCGQIFMSKSAILVNKKILAKGVMVKLGQIITIEFGPGKGLRSELWAKDYAQLWPNWFDKIMTRF